MPSSLLSSLSIIFGQRDIEMIMVITKTKMAPAAISTWVKDMSPRIILVRIAPNKKRFKSTIEVAKLARSTSLVLLSFGPNFTMGITFSL